MLNFDNRLVKQLPFIAQKVATSPLTGAHLAIVNDDVAQLIDLTQTPEHREEILNIFSGKTLPQGAKYHAQVYAGHQFGQFVPQLGDGRAISLGEIKNKQGRLFDVQLKGAGPTPFSRMGDGRAVLRSCIREYLASEAMAALNIPTTRALCIVASDHDVVRESIEKGAIMTRVAETYLRFGHFEYFYHHGKKEQLNQLADYCLSRHYPDCLNAPNPHLAMFEQIIKRTATLIAKWQAHGFAHGVMNTDNMSIIGLTLDYGPFGFLDEYQPNFICNHSDHTGRYAFAQQPSIGLWNLNALAITFSHWLSTDEITQALKTYEPTLVQHYLLLMQAKLGLAHWHDTDQLLLGQWLNMLTTNNADYTNSFRQLNTVFVDDNNNDHCQALIKQFNDKNNLTQWLTAYRKRLANNTLNIHQRTELQNKHNAKFILRNYLAQHAIEKAEAGDYSEIKKLEHVLATPFNEQPANQQYANCPPSWSKNLEISCSS